MLKRNETLLLIASVLILLLTVRLVFFFASKSEFEVGDRVEIEHTFLKLPYKNFFQQYFYVENVLVSLPLYPEYGYGDKLRLKGTVETVTSSNENGLTKRLVIKNPEVKIVESGGLAVVKFVRQKVLLAYESALPPREAGLMAGIVLGAQDGINPEFKEDLKRTGMLHVVVASGSNVVLVAGIIFGLINGVVKKKYAIIFTVIGIFFYALLTGFDPPIVRASIMATFAFVAMLFGRQRTALMSLFFSGWLMLLVAPNLISDIGFQLSFSATLGIVLFQKVVSVVFKIIPNLVKEDFATTFSAQIGALPFLLIAFGQVNLLSIFINVLLLWTVPIIMILGLISGVLSLVAPILSLPLLLLAYPFLLIFSKVVELTSIFYVPLSLTSFTLPIVILYYLVIVYFLLRKRSKT